MFIGWSYTRFVFLVLIGNVKIKSSHGGHLEFTISKRFTNLVQDHPMIIPAKQFKANMAWMVLKWSIFKIVSSDPDFHPRWPPSADIL
jgi:hypothetical protein